MKKNPLVLCLTNAVAANFTANCLLAIGARPAMVEEPSEAEELAAVADALLVNLGTVTERQAEAMRRAVRVANAKGIPWVLDPVGVQILSCRRNLARELIGLKPSLIRGNKAEIDSLGPTGIVTLATGPIDTIEHHSSDIASQSDLRLVDISNHPNNRKISISGGVLMLQTVTATGCAQGGVCAAFLGRGQSPQDAALSASKLLKRAGEVAWERAKAPGSFQVALVDALWELSHD